MKKTIILSVLLLSLTGCGTTPEPEKNNDVIKPTTTNSTTTNPLQDKPLPVATFRTMFALSSNTTEAKVGDTITLSLSLSGAQEKVSTVSTTMLFDPMVLKAEKIDTGDSKFPMVVKAEQDNAAGTITLSMSNNSGGEQGDNLPVAKIEFTVLKAGESVLSMDGNKTTVLTVENANVAPLISTLPTVSLNLED